MTEVTELTIQNGTIINCKGEKKKIYTSHSNALRLLLQTSLGVHEMKCIAEMLQFLPSGMISTQRFACFPPLCYSDCFHKPLGQEPLLFWSVLFGFWFVIMFYWSAIFFYMRFFSAFKPQSHLAIYNK